MPDDLGRFFLSTPNNLKSAWFRMRCSIFHCSQLAQPETYSATQPHPCFASFGTTVKECFPRKRIGTSSRSIVSFNKFVRRRKKWRGGRDLVEAFSQRAEIPKLIIITCSYLIGATRKKTHPTAPTRRTLSHICPTLWNPSGIFQRP